jgi:hypothetical protein
MGQGGVQSKTGDDMSFAAAERLEFSRLRQQIEKLIPVKSIIDCVMSSDSLVSDIVDSPAESLVTRRRPCFALIVFLASF